MALLEPVYYGVTNIDTAQTAPRRAFDMVITNPMTFMPEIRLGRPWQRVFVQINISWMSKVRVKAMLLPEILYLPRYLFKTKGMLGSP
jgi:hypothetical protein